MGSEQHQTPQDTSAALAQLTQQQSGQNQPSPGASQPQTSQGQKVLLDSVNGK